MEKKNKDIFRVAELLVIFNPSNFCGSLNGDIEPFWQAK